MCAASFVRGARVCWVWSAEMAFAQSWAGGCCIVAACAFSDTRPSTPTRRRTCQRRCLLARTPPRCHASCRTLCCLPAHFQTRQIPVRDSAEATPAVATCYPPTHPQPGVLAFVKLCSFGWRVSVADSTPSLSIRVEMSPNGTDFLKCQETIVTWGERTSKQRPALRCRASLICLTLPVGPFRPSRLVFFFVSPLS